MSGRELLMIAARAPVPGEVKTRLGKGIGMEAAATLYRAFLRDLADRIDSTWTAVTPGRDLAWTHSPPDADFRSSLMVVTGRTPPPGTLFVPQDGDDWGVRQANLLHWGHERGYDRVVLIASDSPQLGLAAIDDAFAALRTHDVVLGRVRDGGYYLIGMAGFADLFSGVRMGTATAADGVVAAARLIGRTVVEVSPTFDVDEVGDLDLLVDALRDEPELCPHTRRALANLSW